MRRTLSELKREEHALELEISVARDPAPYLVVNLLNRTVELKARGRTLRRFEIKNSDSQPAVQGAAGAVWKLTEIRPLQVPVRPKMKAGAGEEATVAAAEDALWEPSRMPRDYDLLCETENLLEIRGLSMTSGSRVVRFFTAPYRVLMDWYRQRRTPGDRHFQHILRLWLNEDDSRVLFWSLPRKLALVILH